MSKKKSTKKKQANVSKRKVASKIKNTPQKSSYVLPSLPTGKKFWLPVLVALVVTFLCFSPSLDYGFVNWDDDRNIFKNEHITTLKKGENFWINSQKIFKSTVIGNYNPLSIWSFAVEKVTYGMDNLGMWHLTNILLHLIAVLFVYKLCLLLGLSWRGAVFVAVLFGIHPMRVESVAWLTERKDVLFGAFYMAALYLYTKGKLTGKNYHIWISLLFGLSLFSKIQAVILPISMVLIDYYFDKKISVSGVIKKAPYFLMSLAFGLMGIYFLQGEGSLETNTSSFEGMQRLFVGSYSYVVYLVKLVVPYKLSPLYPYPSAMPWYYYPTILIFPAVAYALWRAYKKGHNVLFFGLAFFSANIFFLLQILGAGQGFLADRFTYIAYFGLFFLGGWGLDRLLEKYSDKKSILLGGAAALTLVFSWMTYQQTQVWQDTETLWTHVLKYYKKSTLPYGNRANYYRDVKRYDEALVDYNKSISLNPRGEQAYNSRARLYFNMSNHPDTIQLAYNDYSKAIELSPQNGEFYINRGATLARLGRINDAIKDMTQGLKLKPDHVSGYLNRSLMYNQLGDHSTALKDIETYLQLRPYDANMWYEKGRALRNLGNNTEAINAYSRAIQLNSNQGLFWHERARSRRDLNDIANAKSDLSRAIALGYKASPQLRQSLGM